MFLRADFVCLPIDPRTIRLPVICIRPPSAPLYDAATVARLGVKSAWPELLAPGKRAALEAALVPWLVERRWFRGKALARRTAHIADVLTVAEVANQVLLTLEVEFTEDEPQKYLIPLAFIGGDDLVQSERDVPQAIVAYVTGLDRPGALVDSAATGHGASLLLSLFGRQGARGEGRTQGACQPSLKALLSAGAPPARATDFEQTNSTLIFGDQLVLKLYRQIEDGTSTELQIGEFLTRSASAALVPRTLGSVTYCSSDGDEAVIALAQQFVPNQGTAWQMALDRAGAFFDGVLSQPDVEVPSQNRGSRVAHAEQGPDRAAWDHVGPYLGLARTLGVRTAEVHIALGGRTDAQGFAPEPFGKMHQQSISHSTRALMERSFKELRKKTKQLSAESALHVETLLAREQQLEKRIRQITTVKIEANRIRCHGDLHLGQVLSTGDDFVIIDFEGEPARPLRERAYKRCALRDVTGMMRSFNYVTESVLRGGRHRDSDSAQLGAWARYWEEQVCASYLGGYLETAKGQSFLPADPRHIDLLLDFFAIEKAIYEIEYEMNNRPDWLPIPIAGLQNVLDTEAQRD